jgi:hypothetical protein
MTVIDLLNAILAKRIDEALFLDHYQERLRDPQIGGADAECLNQLIDDVNMAEHVPPLFDRAFLWRVEECARLLDSGASATEIRKFFATHASL